MNFESSLLMHVVVVCVYVRIVYLCVSFEQTVLIPDWHKLRQDEELALFLIPELAFLAQKSKPLLYGGNTLCKRSINKCDKWTVGALSITALLTNLKIGHVFGGSPSKSK